MYVYIDTSKETDARHRDTTMDSKLSRTNVNIKRQLTMRTEFKYKPSNPSTESHLRRVWLSGGM